MISVLANPELSRLFTDDEKLMVQMAVKTNIVSKAKKTIFEFNNDEKDRMIKYDQEGLKFR